MGKNGSRQVLVNSKGKEVGELDEKPAVPGDSLKLTLDIDLQIAAEEAMGDKNGAMVAMDPHTGEILAMVSRPTFDPNDFAVRISRDEWNKLVTDPDKPLLNKAIQAQLAPGSTFKIIDVGRGVAGKYRPDVECALQWRRDFLRPPIRLLGEDRSRCGRSHQGHLSILRRFLLHAGGKAGHRTHCQVRDRHGIGPKTGIDLPEEASGVMPSEEWKVRNFKQKWFAGETISVGIGQGAVATTPVQLMRAISAISMGGRMVVPHVASPTGLPPDYLETHNYTESKEFPDRSGGVRHDYGCHGTGVAARRYGALGAHSRHRYRGQDGIGTDCVAGGSRQACQ